MDSVLKQGQKVKEEVVQFLKENFYFNIETFTLNEDDSFMEKGIIDSTGILELIEFLEEKYSIYIEDDELTPENLDSLNRVEVFIARKVHTD